MRALRHLAGPLAFLVVGTAIVASTQLEWSSERTSAPPHARPADSRRQATTSSTTSTTASTTTTLAPEPPPPGPMPTTTLAPEPIAAPPPQLPAAGDGECANPVVSEATARGESGCRWDAYNAAGCADPQTGIPRGCLGFYQLDEGHFYEVSPWNSNVPGTCADLADRKWDPAVQTECASRLDASAWN